MSGTYLHLGGQYVVPRASVAGIFDIDNTTSARSTREMLAAAEKKRRGDKRGGGPAKVLRSV